METARLATAAPDEAITKDRGDCGYFFFNHPTPWYLNINQEPKTNRFCVPSSAAKGSPGRQKHAAVAWEMMLRR
jgi:hypothetical protein